MTCANPSDILSSIARKYLRLSTAANVGPIRVRNLVEHLGSVDAVLEASVAELQQVDQVGRKSAEAIFAARSNAEAVEREIHRAAECNLRILCPEDDDYPKPLRNIPDPPICLYVRGTLEPADAVAIAIVGTRRCSHYGREQAMRFGELLARAGFTVVSGLARGIDGFAHRGAIRGGGRTLAVLGNGLAAIYPPDHLELAKEIAANGAVVTELPIDTSPDAKNFPARNRIITGLSLGVLVIEAPLTSGALITARLASEYNREIFALPGNVDRPDLNAGSNALIRDGGAKLVTCLEDVLDELKDVGRIMRRGSDAIEPPGSSPTSPPSGGSPGGRPQLARLSDAQRAVFDAIHDGAEQLDSVCERTELAAGVVTSAVTSLELVGLVRQLPGGRVVLRA